MEPLGKTAWSLAYRVPSSLTSYVSKVTSWQVQELQDVLRASKREVFTKSIDIIGMFDDNFLTWLLGLKRHLKIKSNDSL